MTKETAGSFKVDIHRIRKHAREKLEDGAVTESYPKDLSVIIDLLQGALATELVCVLRYRQNAIVAENIGADVAAREFWEHADQELAHADRLARRIALLGGTPDLNPDTLTERSHADYRGFQESDPDLLESMLKENLIAERIAIESYQEIVRYIGDKDPTTRRLFEDILAEEEEHADEIQALLSAIRPKRGESSEVHAP